MVEGWPGQAHRPGHVREDLIPKKLDGTDGAASRPRPVAPTVSTACIRTSLLRGPGPLANRERFAFQQSVG